MIEKKFRAWSIEKQRYIYFGISDVPEWVHPAEVEQFIGQHDKNGKEYYEGDIAEDGAMRDIVTMDRFPMFWLKNESWGT